MNRSEQSDDDEEEEEESEEESDEGAPTQTTAYIDVTDNDEL